MSFGTGSRTWSKDDIEKAIAMRDRGIAAPVIAEKLGRTNGAIYNLFYRLRDGITTPESISSSTPRRPWTNEEHVQAMEMRAKGLSYSAVGRLLGRSPGSVDSRLRTFTPDGTRRSECSPVAAKSSSRRSANRRWCYVIGDQFAPVEDCDKLPPGGRFEWRPAA